MHRHSELAKERPRARPTQILANSGAALIVMLAGAGCTGIIDGASTVQAGPAAPGPGPGNGGSGSGIAGASEVAACGNVDEIPVLPAAPLRRLSHAQYDFSAGYALGLDVDASKDFPGEARDHGFVGSTEQTSVSEAQLRAYQASSARLAKSAASHWQQLAPCAEASEACAVSTLSLVGQRLLRRPLGPADREDNRSSFLAGQQAAIAAGDPSGAFVEGLRWGLEALLFSPEFLYRAEVASPDLALASRLSYMLWQSPPDDLLLVAAQDGTLRANLEQEVTRMQSDPRARRALRSFVEQWLGLQRLDTLDREPALFPSFSPALALTMKEETQRFFEHVWSSGAQLSSLFAADYGFINASLADIYQLEAPGTELRQVPLLGPRRGLLTQAGVLAAYANATATSPIHRGLFIYNRLLCRDVPPPPTELMVTEPAPQEGKTTRERFESHASTPVCKGCHSNFDGLGFAFEKYDSLGRYRETEDGVAIDDSGSVFLDGQQQSFSDALALTELLAHSEDVEDCLLRQWFRAVVGRDWTAADDCERQRFKQAFIAQGRRLSALPLLTARSAWFSQHTALGENGACE